MRLAAALTAVLLLAGVAIAGDDVLQLKAGRLVAGTIVSTDGKGVTIRTEAGEARFDWDSLTPLSQYEVRSERLEPKDAKGRVDLAEFCIRFGLYTRARTELATARGLGFADTKRLENLRDAADQAEADETFTRVDQLLVEEEYEKALDELRTYLRDAPPDAAGVKKAHDLVTDTLRRMENAKARAEEEAKADAATEKHEALAKKIEKYLAHVDDCMKAYAEAFAEALKYDEIGNRTRAREGYEGAEKQLIDAYRTLIRLQRTVRRGVAWDKADERKGTIRKKLVGVYLGLAKMYVDDRNYKTGVTFVNKALYFDPVNKEALELRKKIDENRLHRSARKITNTPGVRTTGPGGVSSGN